MGKEKEQILETIELPSIKKIVDCPRCYAKIEVEFELDLEKVVAPVGALESLKKEKADND